MIEDLVGDVRGDAEPGHAGDAGASQIMKPPSRDARKRIKLVFRRAEALERELSGIREHKLSIRLCACQDSDCLIGQVGLVSFAVLGALGWKPPESRAQIN